MFKRANKVTALLVAAASILSVVPAMAADSTKLSRRDGTVKQGIAFDGGAYSYYGYRTSDDDTGVYYNNDGASTKEKLDDDLEDYRFNLDSKYGTKYAYAKENSNSDEYLIDLSTGKIVDDDNSIVEKADSARSKLANKLKKADRYEETLDDSDNLVTNFSKNYGSAIGQMEQILPGQFGEVWYKYKVTTTGSSICLGFSNEKGEYVDLSQETNIRVYSSKTKRAEYIKEFDDENKDAAITLKLIDSEAIAQDKDYIYAITTVAVTDNNDATKNRDEQYIQKISKAQGSKDDGEAYTAKSIDSYLLQAPSAAIKYDEGDFDNAFDRLFGQGDYTKERMLGVVAKDGNLYLYTAKLKDSLTETDKLQVAKLKLGKFKKDVKVGGTVVANDVDVNAVKKDGDTDDGDIVDFDLETTATVAEDEGLQGFQKVSDYSHFDTIQIAGRDVYRLPSVSIDTAGNVWGIEKGKIIKYTGTSKDTLYTVDRSITAIDAYDDNNIIAWDPTGDVYTTITEGKKQTQDDALVVNPDINKDKFANGFGADGKFYENGTAAVSKWVSDAGKWYFLDATGAKKTGWAQDGATWYLLGTDGVMLTGWQSVNGVWYYLNPVNTNGAMKTGWFQDTTGTWYYADASGAMLANTVVDGYKLGANGAWVQ